MTEIVVLVAQDESDLPGLDGLPDAAKVTTVREENDLRAALPDAEVLVVTDFRTGLLERCWPKEHSLRWVHATSAGVDALMFPDLIESGVTLTNAKGVFDRGIAEYVLGATLMFAKDTLGNLHYQRQHQWCHRDTELIDERQVLVVGAGSIGGEVSQLLRATGMKVTGVARSARDDERFDQVIANDDLFDALANADFVVITAPLTEATEGLFDERAFAAMKKSARLINVGRGPIVNTDDLVTALRKGDIAGAALDVFEKEPLPARHPLWDMPNVMISAHMAGDFIGWRRALGEQFVANFERYLKDDELFNQVPLNS
ncbi:D-2-hydroxyacid dehydrogenase [Marinimicrobium alkaliphilum]|uniref:D-2-hydroxyacid dehydrogenase n=1 Tax=Marinimicrobium alkaliphilum TaxID=2202654 RepID=UPI000DBABF24|nr:D-2-hydroxyacid dehydrogenase [Marinimicrobium alkaliphilum]